MANDDRTPLQRAVAARIAASDRTRDHYDSQLRKALETTGKPLWDIERGKVKRPSPRILRAIEQVLGFEPDELVNLVHPRDDQPAVRMPISERREVSSDSTPTLSVDGGETVEITRLDLSLPMGPGATVDDFIESEPLKFDLGYVRSFTRTPPHRLRLAAGAGDSMFPTLVPNDLVWIDTTQNQLLHADRIYAASINGGAAIKRLRPVAGGRRVLVISDNKMVEPYEVDASEVVIWGRVIRFARDL
ncbi:S24 family peptidase [Sphingomonas xinjiangensis]|uniref:Phage repressor protein C with HTH and peptisase S24 domain n=1 Tax=Sphingomonas xinjiangensis TaxID=643568 RepID=A0A840Y7N7_9SPHN|nr:S24 family peptidase [Sphingomonas xinjiangensis]MBB5709307.1 phage repressor protein C with HTH and peptisase S24 domain [Sphingomonas xinjiangensis]